jgi:hypothetical protein
LGLDGGKIQFIMKKLVVLLISVLFFLTLTIGCKKENNDYKAKDLYGLWQVTHQAGTDSPIEWYDMTNEDCFFDLRKNGTFHCRGYFEGYSGIYELKGNILYGEFYAHITYSPDSIVERGEMDEQEYIDRVNGTYSLN